MTLPLIEHVQQRQMITFRDIELLPCRVRFFHPFLRPIEHTRDGKHRHDGQHLRRALVLDGGDEHLCHGRFHRKFRHLATNRREVADVVEGTKYPELVHGVENVGLAECEVSNSSYQRRAGDIDIPEEVDP